LGKIKSGGQGFALNEQGKKGGRGSFWEGELFYKIWTLMLKNKSGTNTLAYLGTPSGKKKF
jgi:hypothetical protein